MAKIPLNHAEQLSLYERQSTFVSDVIYQNPDSLRVFDDAEEATFKKYFLPDWVDEENFARYYEDLEQGDPDLMNRANELLKKFLEQNDLDKSDLLLPK